MTIIKDKNGISARLTILHVVTTLGTGGMENGIVNLCNHHDRNRFLPIMCCLKTKGEMANRLKKDISLIEMGLSEGKPFFQPIKMKALLKQLRPDIVHTHGLAGGSYVGILGAKIAGIPVVINGEHGSFFLKPHQLYLQKFLAFLTDANLSVSQSLKNKITENLGIVEKKITVIPNGVDTSIFSGQAPTNHIKKELQERHGIVLDNADLVIVSVGSLKPEKNQLMLLKALTEFKKQASTSNICALFVGDGIDRARLEQYTTSNRLNSHVAFLGKREDVPNLLSLSNVLISTSIAEHEGMSNAILEAFSSGLPVIATSSVGTIELIEEGENGFLIEQDDIAGLAQRILFLAQNPKKCEQMGKSAFKLVRKQYSIHHMVTQYENLYIDFFLGKK